MNYDYKNRNDLVELYHEQGLTLDECSNEFGCSVNTVRNWMKKHNVPIRSKKESKEHKFGDMDVRNESVLRELYIEKGQTLPEIAEELDCAEGTVHKWIGIHGLERRSIGDVLSNDVPTLKTNPTKGYEYLHFDSMSVPLHRIMAVAEHGIEAVSGMEVHHKSGVPWDNRPDNLELLTKADHCKEHNPVMVR